MSQHGPLDVSVVMSTYQRADGLRHALDTALQQQGVRHEVIVVDNGTTDHTTDVLAAIDHPALRVIRNEESLGAGGGRNTGFRAAQGTHVCNFDDDDLWAPNKLRAQIDEMDRTGRQWSYTGCVYINKNDVVIGGVPAPTAEDAAAALPTVYTIPGGLSSMLWRRDLLDHEDLLDTGLRMNDDWDLSLRLLRAGGLPAVVNEPLVAYRQHASNNSKSPAAFQYEWEILRERHADLLDGRDQNLAAFHAFTGSQRMQAGDRVGAIKAYTKAVTGGDVKSIVRAAAVMVPQSWQGALRRRLLSDDGWMRRAHGWLDDVSRVRA